MSCVNGGVRTDTTSAQVKRRQKLGEDRLRQVVAEASGRENPVTRAAKRDTTRKVAGNDRDRPKESRMARAKGRPKAKTVVKATGR